MTALLERTCQEKIFFGPLVRIESIFGGVIVGADGDAVLMSPKKGEAGACMPSGPAGRSVSR